MTTAENLIPDTSAPADVVISDDLDSSDDAGLSEAYRRAMASGGDDEDVGAVQPEPAKDSLVGEKAGAVAGSQQAVSVPSDLPASVKDVWAKLSPDQAKVMAEYKTAQDRKFSELGRQIEQVRPVADRLSSALQNVPELRGYTPDALAQGALELATIQAKLERGSPQDRTAIVMEIAQRYGVNLTGQQPTQDQNLIYSLQQKIAQLEGAVGQQPDIDAHVSDAIQRREVSTQIQAFATAKPLYSVVEHLLPAFVAEAKASNPAIGVTEALDYAYQKAIESQPALKDLVQAQEAAKAATPIARISEQRADAAKKAAAINVKPATPTKPRDASDDELMASAYRRAMAS